MTARSSPLSTFHLVDLLDLISKAFGNERRSSSDRNYWRQRLVSNGRAARCDRAKDRDSIWTTFGLARGRPSEWQAGLFFAATRSWPSAFAARVESSGQHLRAAFAQRALDCFRDRSREFAGKICAAGCLVAFAVLRPRQPAPRAHFF